MLRFLITVFCFVCFLCVGNILQIKKIKEEKAYNIMTQLGNGIKGSSASLRSKQRVFYKGLGIVGDYSYYFLATQLMAPSYLLESKKEPFRSGDTVLVICNLNELNKYFPENNLQVIWQNTDAQYLYLLGKQK